MGLVDQQPLRPHRLHPQTDVADEDREPYRPEHPDTQRRPGRGVRRGVGRRGNVAHGAVTVALGAGGDNRLRAEAGCRSFIIV